MTNRKPPRPPESDNIHWLEASQENLKSGGGGGTFNGMEERVAHLEGRFDGIERQLDRIETNMLTKWDVAKVVAMVIGAFMAAVIFGPNLMAAIASLGQ